ncbi:MAG: 3-deoxy-manno-octulosonate cytidylyltransferase [Myxococcaceae bacterium]|nr:3-deoxy-manno-octulosonate cytidylyltransferase [Myxococcaceae bacterium]MBH2005749.1 3-deoxy-manno-octulosonate cytidylyltransferase [Myxococcaceae bacterium]
MSAFCIIPARLYSARFPQKILAIWHGKTLLQHVWERASLAKRFDQIWIACDHLETFRIATEFGARVVLSSRDHPTGSDRIAEVIQAQEVDFVVNLQADEPQMNPQLLDQIVDCLEFYPSADCVTPISTQMQPQAVRCTTDRCGRALYFSRHLPYGYRHVGLYGYRKAALLRFVNLPPGQWEASESLEQLRLLEAGMSIQTFQTSYNGISVDTPEDFARLDQQRV